MGGGGGGGGTTTTGPEVISASSYYAGRSRPRRRRIISMESQRRITVGSASAKLAQLGGSPVAPGQEETAIRRSDHFNMALLVLLCAPPHSFDVCFFLFIYSSFFFSYLCKVKGLSLLMEILYLFNCVFISLCTHAQVMTCMCRHAAGSTHGPCAGLHSVPPAGQAELHTTGHPLCRWIPLRAQALLVARRGRLLLD